MTEDEMEKIANEISARLARERCSASDYRELLRSVIDVLRTDITASEESDRDA